MMPSMPKIGEQILRFMEEETVEKRPTTKVVSTTNTYNPRKCRYCGSQLNTALATCSFCEAKQ